VAVSARNAAEQALLQLRRLLNVPMARPVALASPLAFADGRVPVLQGESADGSARPALAGAEAMVEARRQAVRAELAGRWPKLTASATVSQQAYPTDFAPRRHDFVAAANGSVRLEWPLFQGFRTFGTVEQARGELRQAEAERERERATVALDVAQARQEVQRMLSTLAARRGTAALATRAHHLATVRWQNGLSTQLEVSDARLQMQTAEVNEIAATKDYRLALLRLERACGRPLVLATMAIDDLPSTFPHDGAH
jgi:outer membrane protein TolC